MNHTVFNLRVVGMPSSHVLAWMCLVAALSCNGLITKQNNCINILSVVERSSIDMCIIKIQSIVVSAREPDRINFGFLAMSRSDAKILQTRIYDCLPNITYEIKVYNDVKSPLVHRLVPVLKQLSHKGFEKPVIYARIILPDIFIEMQRFLYLDNDIVGNIDVADIYDTPLVMGNNQPTHSGFVWERQTLNHMYLSHHLNYSHEVVKRVYENQTRAKNDFFNSGVWLCDASLWRRLNNSDLVLDLVVRNVHEKFCIRCSDQEFFFLAFSRSNTARLPIHFNYRRLLKHSVERLIHNRGMP